MARGKPVQKQRRRIVAAIEKHLRYETLRAAHPKFARQNQQWYLCCLLRDCENSKIVTVYFFSNDGDYHSAQFEAKLVASLVREYKVEVDAVYASLELLYVPSSEETIEVTDRQERTRNARYQQTLYLQRSAKQKQRAQAELRALHSPQNGLMPQCDKFLELERSFKDRVPHRHGFGKSWRPTRMRFDSTPHTTSWKDSSQCRKQYLVHLD